MEGIYGMRVRSGKYGDGVLKEYRGDTVKIRFADRDVDYWTELAFQSGALKPVNEADGARIEKLLEGRRKVSPTPYMRTLAALSALAGEAKKRKRGDVSAERVEGLKEAFADVLSAEDIDKHLATFMDCYAADGSQIVQFNLRDMAQEHFSNRPEEQAAPQGAADTKGTTGAAGVSGDYEAEKVKWCKRSMKEKLTVHFRSQKKAFLAGVVLTSIALFGIFCGIFCSLITLCLINVKMSETGSMVLTVLMGVGGGLYYIAAFAAHIVWFGFNADLCETKREKQTAVAFRWITFLPFWMVVIWIALLLFVLTVMILMLLGALFGGGGGGTGDAFKFDTNEKTVRDRYGRAVTVYKTRGNERYNNEWYERWKDDAGNTYLTRNGKKFIMMS